MLSASEPTLGIAMLTFFLTADQTDGVGLFFFLSTKLLHDVKELHMYECYKFCTEITLSKTTKYQHMSDTGKTEA